MFKQILFALCITVVAVSADPGAWSQTMSFNLYGKSFLCNLLSGGMYSCNNGANSAPAPAPTPSYNPPTPAPTPAPTPKSAPSYTKTNPIPTDPTPAPVPAPVYTPTPAPAPKPVDPVPIATPDPTPAPTGSADTQKPLPCNSGEWGVSMLAAHNEFRSKMIDTAPLSYDDDLAGQAATYAQTLMAQGGTLQHSGVQGEGENLYLGYGDNCEVSARSIGMMMGECTNYQWANPGFQEDSGHFTQILWKATQKVGCGAATSGDKCIIVMRYSPPGNVIGHFGDQVDGYKPGDSCAAYTGP